MCSTFNSMDGIAARGGIISFYVIFFPIYPTRAPFKTSRLNRYRCASLATAAAAAVAPSIATAGHKKKKSRVRIYLLLLLSLYIHQTPTLLYGTNLDHRMGYCPHIIIGKKIRETTTVKKKNQLKEPNRQNDEIPSNPRNGIFKRSVINAEDIVLLLLLLLYNR